MYKCIYVYRYTYSTFLAVSIGTPNSLASGSLLALVCVEQRDRGTVLGQVHGHGEDHARMGAVCEFRLGCEL